MLLIDKDPQVYHDDEYILAWAWANGRDTLPIVDIELGGAMTSDTPDIARIYYNNHRLIKRYKLNSILNR